VVQSITQVTRNPKLPPGPPEMLPEDTTIEQRFERPGLITSGDEVLYDGVAETEGYEPRKTVPERPRRPWRKKG
jgi:hypothetical protein